MTSGVFSDITGKIHPSDSTYKIDVLRRGENVHLEFDCNWKDIENNSLKELMQLALKDKEDLKGKEWYKIQKNKETDKWERKTVENPNE